jgi:hypothetical protein
MRVGGVSGSAFYCIQFFISFNCLLRLMLLSKFEPTVKVQQPFQLVVRFQSPIFPRLKPIAAPIGNQKQSFQELTKDCDNSFWHNFNFFFQFVL